MNTKSLGLLAVTLASLLAGNALADDRPGQGFDRRDGRHAEYLRADFRDSYYIPAWATDVGDGWIIGSKPEPGGFAIYRWNGYRWNEVHGAGIRIGGSYSQPWHINDRGHRYVWNGWEWLRDYRHDDRRVFRADRSRRSYDYYRGFDRDRLERRLNRLRRNRW